MSFIQPPNLWEFPSLLYRTKAFEFNRYYIEHSSVHGVLGIANIPISILSVDADKLPPGVVITDDNRYVVGTTDIVTFVNKGLKKDPTSASHRAQPRKKVGLLDYIIKERTDEPWNEYVVQDSHNKLLRIRTILTDVSYYDGEFNHLGDPVLETKQAVTIAVTDKAAPESGMT